MFSNSCVVSPFPYSWYIALVLARCCRYVFVSTLVATSLYCSSSECVSVLVWFNDCVIWWFVSSRAFIIVSIFRFNWVTCCWCVRSCSMMVLLLLSIACLLCTVGVGIGDSLFVLSFCGIFVVFCVAMTSKYVGFVLCIEK